MITHLSSAADPDAAFAAFAGFVEGLPASVQIFSLLDHNRDLTRLLGDILVLSPRLGTSLRGHPMLFDLVLFRDFFAPLSDAGSFEAELRDDIRDLPVESALEIITRKTRERRFQAEVQGLSGVAGRATVGRALADSAEAVIRVVRDLARTDMDRRHGTIGGDILVIAMGRLGLGSLTATSDLDLVFAWDAPGDGQSSGRSGGGGVLGATAYYTRLAQTMASWLGGATGEGTLFSIDTRLRPDGEKGAFAPRLDRLADYYRDEAWLWEKLALSKARVVTPASTLTRRVDQLLAGILAAPVPAGGMAQALHDMRQRMRAHGDAPAASQAARQHRRNRPLRGSPRTCRPVQRQRHGRDTRTAGGCRSSGRGPGGAACRSRQPVRRTASCAPPCHGIGAQGPDTLAGGAAVCSRCVRQPGHGASRQTAGSRARAG